MHLLRKDNKLVRIEGGLATVENGACCCDDTRYALSFAECCDGQPVLWILETVVPANCETVLIGGACFRRNGGRALVSELQRAGSTVYLNFPGVCVSGCIDERCRECPSDCCIYGFLPECERRGQNTTNGQCCTLGALYRLTYTETYQIETTGYDVRQGGVVSCSAEGVPQLCRGYSPGLLERYTLRVAATELWSGRDRYGIPCYDQETFTHTRTEERIVFQSGGYDYPTNCIPGPTPRDPRYENTSTTLNIAAPLFGRGVLPAPYYQFDRVDEAEAVYLCNRGEYVPFDPATCLELSQSVESNYGCSGGESQLVEDNAEYSCCDTQGRQLETVTRIRGTRRWTIEVLGRNGCESDPCAGRRPGGLVRDGEPEIRGSASVLSGGGCRGCRGEAGL